LLKNTRLRRTAAHPSFTDILGGFRLDVFEHLARRGFRIPSLQGLTDTPRQIP